MPWSWIGQRMPWIRPGRGAAIALMLHMSVATVWLTAADPWEIGAQRQAAAVAGAARMTSNAGVGAGVNVASQRNMDPPVGSVIANLGRILISSAGEHEGAGTPDQTGLSGLQQAGAHAAALQAAEAEVARAWATLREARAEQVRVMSSPEIIVLATAERELAQAQARATRADVDLQRINQPDPVQLDAAERALWRAEATLRVARAARPGSEPAQNPVGQAWEIRQAELAVQESLARRDALRVGPTAEALAAVHLERERAHAALHEATIRVEQLRHGVAAPPLEAMHAAVLSATASLTDAEARLQTLRSPLR